jgi:hypothetical protein
MTARLLRRLAAPGRTFPEKIAKGVFWAIAMNPGVWLFVIVGLYFRAR